jgi:purine-binding chemotaxis protein CheW
MEQEEISTADQYLTFIIDDESFAISIERVREVLDTAIITEVPATPDHVRGVLNLRGNVVPVVDLKQKFGLGTTEKTVDTCTVIVEVDVAGDEMIVGFMVDSMREVFDIDESEIEPPPTVGTRFSVDYMQGMAKHGDEFIVILDIDKLFADETSEASAQ